MTRWDPTNEEVIDPAGAADPVDRYGLEGLADRLADVMALGCESPLSHVEDSGGSPEGSGDDADEGGAAPAAYGDVGGYKLIERLGQGGSGVVWLAVQPGTGREVAVKVLGPAAVGSDSARARFQREVELAASLEHPHIARVYEGGTDGGTDFCAMERIKGRPLDQFVADRQLSRREMLSLAESVCRAVAFAHQHGVIHRDLKFSNILVSDDGAPHLVDFGLGRLLTDGAGALRAATITIAGEVSGTVAFMPPEQAAGLMATDTRSDVYSLGAILYWLLTGGPPHDLTGTRGRVLRRIEEEDVRRPRLADPSIDADLEALLLKALAKAPADRYGTAGEFAEDLRHYLAGEPLVARPATARYFMAKWVRRHKGRLAAAAAVAALLAGTSVSSYVKIKHSRDWAVAERQRADAARQVAERQERAADQHRAIAIQQEIRALDAERLARARQAEAERQRAISEQRLADSLLAQAAALAERRDLVRATSPFPRTAGKSGPVPRTARPACGTSPPGRRPAGSTTATKSAPPPSAATAGAASRGAGTARHGSGT